MFSHRAESFQLNFLAVGPQRTGTTWLDRMLRAHPALCLPQDVKETMFFDRRFAKGVGWYAWHFRDCCERKKRGEVAPTYFDDDHAIRRIESNSPRCKIIIVLRDPATRAFSLYLHHRRKGRVGDSFAEAVRQKPRIVEAGRYAQHVPRWIEAFGEEHIAVVLLDDIKEHPAKVLERICAFLGVEPVAPPEANEAVNAASLPRFPRIARAAATLATTLRRLRLHRFVEWGKQIGLKVVFSGAKVDALPTLQPSQRRRLASLYEKDIRFVETLTGRDLAPWRAPE